MRPGSASATARAGPCATAPSRSRPARHRARRPERRRQDHAAAARGGPDAAERRRGAACSAARRGATRRAVLPAPRLRGAGASALQGLHRRGDARSSAASSTRAGTTASPASASRALGLPLDQKAGKLSGGQQAQVALTLALAKRPDLLVLDEPVASLDPLARREFMQSVMEAVAESGMTVILSSHIVADLERVCDHLVILSTAEVQLAGEIESIVASHRVLTGLRTDPRGRARARGDPREPHAAPDDVARARQRPRLRHVLGAARGRSRGDRARVPRLRRHDGRRAARQGVAT